MNNILKYMYYSSWCCQCAQYPCTNALFRNHHHINCRVVQRHKKRGRKRRRKETHTETRDTGGVAHNIELTACWNVGKRIVWNLSKGAGRGIKPRSKIRGVVEKEVFVLKHSTIKKKIFFLKQGCLYKLNVFFQFLRRYVCIYFILINNEYLRVCFR